MAQMFYLTESDAQALRQMFVDQRRRIGNTVGRGRRDGIEDEESNAPEVYIARVPTDGIAAVDVGITGTGTSAPLDDVASSAECQIYRLIDDGSGLNQATFEPVDGLTRQVYNISTAAIDGDQWLSVVRDKFGVWMPTVQAFATGFTGSRRRPMLIDCDPTLIVTYDTEHYINGMLQDNIEEDT